MRTHRLYGFVLALVTVVGVVSLPALGPASAAAAPRGTTASPSTITTAQLQNPSTIASAAIAAAPLFPASWRHLSSSLAADAASADRSVITAGTLSVGPAATPGVRALVLQAFSGWVAWDQQQTVAQQVALYEINELEQLHHAVVAHELARYVALLAAAPPAGGAWAELRACESHGNYADDTGNGYYGAYQFSAGTWHSLGYGGLPSQAAPGIQDAAAAALEARSGWGQWPACSAKLGL